MLKAGESRQAAPSFNINDEIEKHLSKDEGEITASTP